MANNDYWKARQISEKDWINNNIKRDKDFDAILERHYRSLQNDIQAQINAEYSRLGKTSGWNIADAKARVSKLDVENFNATAQNIVEQAKRLREKRGGVTYNDFTDRTNDVFRLYNATMRINRLEMLKSQIGMQVVNNNQRVSKEIGDKLMNDALAEYTRQAGILGANRSTPDFKRLVQIISAQTGGANFSDRIWNDGNVLKSELDMLLTKSLIQGINPNDIAHKLRDKVNDRVNNAKNAAERIARTESARVQTRVQLDSFDKYGYDFCKWINEPTACQICVDIGEDNSGWGEGVYKTVEVPFIPAHPNCRCSLSAYVPDEAELEAHGKETNKNIVRNDDSDNSFDRTSIESMRNYLKSNYDIDYSAKIPTEYLANMVDFLDDFNNSHPEYSQQSFGKLNVIKSEKYPDSRQNALATTIVPDVKTWKNNYITFNEKYLQEKDTLYKEIERGIKQKWNQPEDPAVGLFAHEYGHSVARTLMTNYAKKNDEDKTTDFFEDNFYKDFFNEVSEEAGGKAFARDKRRLSELQSKGFVSFYGQHSKSEMFAEQFTNAYTKSESDNLNKAFKTTLDRWLKEYK